MVTILLHVSEELAEALTRAGAEEAVVYKAPEEDSYFHPICVATYKGNVYIFGQAINIITGLHNDYPAQGRFYTLFIQGVRFLP